MRRSTPGTRGRSTTGSRSHASSRSAVPSRAIWSIDETRQRMAAHARSAFTGFRKLTLATAASSLADAAKLEQRMQRFGERERAADRAARRRSAGAAARCSATPRSGSRRTTGRGSRNCSGVSPRRTCGAGARCAVRARGDARPPLSRLRPGADRVLPRAIRGRPRIPSMPTWPISCPRSCSSGPRVRDAYEQLLLARALGIVDDAR